MPKKTEETPVRNSRAGASPPPKDLAVTDAIENFVRWSWRHRWQLAPLFGVSVVYAEVKTGGPIFMSILMFVFSLITYLIKRYEVSFPQSRFRGLNQREQLMLSQWFMIVSGWSLFMSLPIPRTWWIEIALLIGGVAYPSYQWITSRSATPVPVAPDDNDELTETAIAWLNRWKENISDATEDVPPKLRKSMPVKGTVIEPAPGAIAFTIDLNGAHGGDVLGEPFIRAIESKLGLPPNTCQLILDHDHSTRVRVILTPNRHLEEAPIVWKGPRRNPDGTVPIGETPDGKTVYLPLNDNDGVFHVRLFGNTGNGKSSTGRVLMAPEVEAGLGLVWLIDGKCGQSMPEVQNAIDWYSIDPKEWASLIDAAYRVMKDRQARYGARGKSFFRVGQEEDPVLTLWLEETSEIKRIVGSVAEKKVLAILQQGRAAGVRVVQVSQSPKMDNIMGGVDGRDLMKVGVLHRPGGRISKTIATEICSAPLDLMALPDGVPGFAGVLAGGSILAPIMRVEHATNEAAAEWAKTVTPRSLEGADLIAAGAAYARRGTAVEIGPVAEEIDEDLEELLTEEVEEPEEPESDVRSWILKVLGMNAEGLRIGEIHQKGNGRPGRSRKNLQNNLRRLEADGRVRQGDGSKWQKVTE